MEFLAVLTVTTAAVFLLRNLIMRMPVAFYLSACAVVVLLFAGSSGLLGVWWRPVILLVQRCMVALALFTVVMFIGVFAKDSRIGLWLRPIRAELSIIACILCLGHMCAYAAPYALRAFSGTMSASMAIAFWVAVALFVLLLVLGITSFGAVKKRLRTTTWKSIQRLAYVFFALAYVHMMLMLAPAAVVGGAQALASVGMYSAVFLAYVVLRLCRAKKEAQCERGDRDAADASILA